MHVTPRGVATWYHVTRAFIASRPAEFFLVKCSLVVRCFSAWLSLVKFGEGLFYRGKDFCNTF